MLALLLLASLSPAYSQPVEEDWERVRSEPERLKLNGTCFGPEGEIIVATRFGIRPDKEGGNTLNVTDIVKYDRRGEELWARRRTDFVGGWVRGLACGASGAIALSNARVTSLYGPDGTERWTSLLAPELSGRFHPQNIAVDSEDSVLISFASMGPGDGVYLAWCDDPESGQDGDTYDIVVLKYGAEGALLWKHVYDGGSFDMPYQIGTDASDNVYVAGATSSSIHAPDYDFLVIKLDSLGNRLWAESYDGGFGQYDHVRSMAVEPDGSVYVTGWSFGTGCDYLTMRLDTAGNQEWSARFDGPSHLTDYAEILAVDPWGGVHVSGTVQFGEREVSAGGTVGRRIVKTTIGTVSYDAQGSERWASLFSRDREYSRNEYPHDITVDEDGDAYVAASVLVREPRRRFLAIKYALETDSPTGEILWTEWRDVGYPEAINVDRKKNVFVVSERQTSDMAIVKGDMAIVKYAPAMFIRGDVNGDGQVPGSVSDAVYLLLYSFVGGPEPECRAAADVDGDGRVGGSVSDAVYLLNHLFLGGLPPEAPYPDCGPGSLSSDDDLGCAKSLGECL